MKTPLKQLSSLVVLPKLKFLFAKIITTKIIFTRSSISNQNSHTHTSVELLYIVNKLVPLMICYHFCTTTNHEKMVKVWWAEKMLDIASKLG